MKKHTKSLNKILISLFVIIIIFNCIIPIFSKAEEEEKKVEGGALLSPIKTFVAFLADASLGFMQKIFMGVDTPLITDEKLTLIPSSEQISNIMGYNHITTSLQDNIKQGEESARKIVKNNFDFELPRIQYSPERIFSNEVPAFDVNFFNPMNNSKSVAFALKDIVAYYYNLLREIVIVGLLLVLTYIGIRIVISSIASEKSKYKEMLKNCVVALCLVFFMHYIMSGITSLCGNIAKGLEIPDNNAIEIQVESNGRTYTYKMDDNVKYDPFMVNVRVGLQFGDVGSQTVYTIIYVVLVIYTVIFSIIYLKRTLFVAFFTMIAPLVAIKYPLDKMHGKKSQTFEFWIKGYMFNMIIQPIHLILYYVVVSTALNLVVTNPVYGLVAIGFLIPADRLVRKFFGFDKMDTTGMLKGMASGALVMTGINKLRGFMGGSKKQKGNSENNKEKNEKGQIRTADSGNNTGSLMNDISGENSNEPENDDEDIDQDVNENEDQVNQEVERSTRNNRTLNIDTNRNNNGNSQNEQENNQRVRTTENEQNEDETGNVHNENENNNNEENQNDNDRENRRINVEDEEQEKTRQKKEENAKKRKVFALKAKSYLKSGLKFTGKGIIKAYGAATFGTIGVAAGLASDKYSNVATFGLGGAIAGKAIANSGIKRVGRLPSDLYRIKEYRNEVRDEAEAKVYTDKERKRILNKRLDDEFMKDKQIKKKYSKAFEVDDPKDIMEEAKKYREYGIVDDDLIIKAMKIEDRSFNSMSDKRKILAAKLSKQLNRNDLEIFRNRLLDNGISRSDVDLIEQTIVKINDWE